MKDKKIKKLGLPYMGSKRKLAEPIVDFILKENPNCKYIYDLFGGGGAISFEAAQREEIKKVFYNEYDTGITELLKKIKTDGITEEFYEWIDRETFHKKKEGKDWKAGLIKTIWSFGNNGNGYMYSDTIEEYKKEAHNYIMKGEDFKGVENIEDKDINKRRLFLSKKIKDLFNEKIKGNKEDLKTYKNIIEKKYTRETKLKFTTWLRTTGIKGSEIDNMLGTKGMGGHYLSIASQPDIPTFKYWKILKEHEKIKKVNVPLWIEELFSKDEKYKETLLNKLYNEDKKKLLNELYNEDKKKLLNELYKLDCFKRGIQHLQRLQQLEKLKDTINFNITNKSYEEVEITTPPEETVIYLDPPYKDTGKYQNNICHKELLEYIKNSDFKIYVSSYEFEELNEVWSKEHRSILSATANNKVEEKLFCNIRGNK